MNQPISANDPILNAVKAAIEAIKFGSVEIVIHDSKVVQIERKEKVRFNTTSPLNTTNPVTDRTPGSSESKDRTTGRSS